MHQLQIPECAMLLTGSPLVSDGLQLKKIEQWIAHHKALGALKQDARFQQDMHDPRIRAIVDAVIDNPENVMRVRSSPAMACLDKLRRLRDVNKQHGGGAINLDQATKAWTDEDARRAQSAHPGGSHHVIACLPCCSHPQLARASARAPCKADDVSSRFM